MSDEIRVLLADDHPVVRKGLRAIVDDAPGMTVVGEASDGEAALTAIETLKPDVAVLDVDMPKLDGFGVARAVLKQHPATRVIILTLHDQEDIFEAAMDLGIQGYLLKDSAMIEIAAGISAVAQGRPYVSSALSMRMLRGRNRAADTPLDSLTPTERRILRLIGTGQSSKEIGQELSIHYRTVENHRTNICRKLGLEGSNALVRYALQNQQKL